MPHFNPIEMVIVLVIVLLLFGGGRIAKLGGELGTAIREFRKGLGLDQKSETLSTTTPAQLSATTEEPIDQSNKQ